MTHKMQYHVKSCATPFSKINEIQNTNIDTEEQSAMAPHNQKMIVANGNSPSEESTLLASPSANNDDSVEYSKPGPQSSDSSLSDLTDKVEESALQSLSSHDMEVGMTSASGHSSSTIDTTPPPSESSQDSSSMAIETFKHMEPAMVESYHMINDSNSSKEADITFGKDSPLVSIGTLKTPPGTLKSPPEALSPSQPEPLPAASMIMESQYQGMVSNNSDDDNGNISYSSHEDEETAPSYQSDQNYSAPDTLAMGYLKSPPESLKSPPESLKSPPEELPNAPPAALPRRFAPISRSGSAKKSQRLRPNPQRDNSNRSSSHFDGEFALSVLNARPIDQATGRRKSTVDYRNTSSMAAAAAAVGAFAAKNDDADEEARAKKSEEKKRRNSSYFRRDTSTFEERFRRKLRESRSLSGSERSEPSTSRSSAVRGGGDGGTKASRRRSSRVSFVSSVGSAYESIDEERQSKFDEDKNMTGFQVIAEGSMRCLEKGDKGQQEQQESTGETKSAEDDSFDDFLNFLNNNDKEDSSRRSYSMDDAIGNNNLKASSELINYPSVESFHRKRRSEGSLATPKANAWNGSASRRASQGSLSTEEYQEFIMKKVAARSDVGMTYSQRKRRDEEEVAMAAATASAVATSATSTQDVSQAATSTQDVSQESKSTITPPLSARTDHVGRITYGKEVFSVEQGEKNTQVKANGQSGNETIVGRTFYQPAPRVKDDEEEKVELSNKDDAVPAEEGKVQVMDAACVAADIDAAASNPVPTAADVENMVEKKSRANPGPRRVSRRNIDPPFSSMTQDGKKKVSTHINSLDPEDFAAALDLPPGTLTGPAVSPRQSDSNLSESFTTMARWARSSGSFRARSLDDGNLPSTNNAASSVAGRRGTYAFGTNNEEHTHALRELADMVEAQATVQATLVVEENPMETVEAIPMDEDNELQRIKQRRLRKQIILVWCPLAFLVIVIVAAIVGVTASKNGDANDGGESIDSPPVDIVFDPMLVQLKEEGVLRCGVPNKYGFASKNNETGLKEGMSVDFCKAVAVAVLGDDYVVDLIEVTSTTRFTALAGGEIDLLLFADTHTMERDFHEARAEVGFQFTDPYFYDGLAFAGKPDTVQCADDFNWLGECRDLKICVIEGTTHVDVLTDIFPLQNIVLKSDAEVFIQGFVDGDCGLIAGEQNDISVTIVRMAGYTGEFVTGEKLLSKEPLAMVTRKNDESWTDVANWVLRALVHAEVANITQENSHELQHGRRTGHDDDISTIDLNRAVKEVGNYGEIYARHMEEVVPRKGLNRLYPAAGNGNPTTGLLYSHPTGVIDTYHYDFAPDGKINQILGRGKLICGILGDEDQSMERDYCSALAASLFSSDSSKVELVTLSKDHNLMQKLDSGELDVIAGVTVSFHSDIIASNKTETGVSGLAFSQPYFYGGGYPSLFDEGSSAPKAMATSQSDADWSTFVYWVVTNSIWAEENGITSADFRKVPEVKLFGEEFEWMFLGPIFSTGNYGQIYDRNIDNLPPRADHDLLNDGSSPQLWSPPF